MVGHSLHAILIYEQILNLSERVVDRENNDQQFTVNTRGNRAYESPHEANKYHS
jgi:hypothetical protein